MSTWTIVVAGGSGTRFGRYKQFAPLGDRRVLDWSLAAAATVSDGLVVVLPPGVAVDLPPGVLVAQGGETRSESVRRGLDVVPADAQVVVVHDAARPLAPPALFEAVVAAVRAGAQAVVPGVALSDTIRRRRGGILDRDQLVAVQTPQAFDASALRRAHGDGAEATDDASLVEASGGEVVVVPGDTANQKITNPGDLGAAEDLVARRLAEGPETRRQAADDHKGSGRDGEETMDIRVGQGFDVHTFDEDPGRPLVLGGVRFPGERGLKGHSDADAIAHACTDALLGAAGLGDIGQLFPDTDPRYAGADSLTLLADAVGRVHGAGWAAANVDCTVVCEAPRLAPRRDEIQQRLSDIVGAPVTVKGKRAEGLGSLGRREGIACWAVALLTRSPRPIPGPTSEFGTPDSGSSAGFTPRGDA